MKEKMLQKIFKVWLSDCTIKVSLIEDEEVDFSYYFVCVFTRCVFPLKMINDFSSYMKKVHNLDCCDFHFDFDCGFFDFQMF